MMCQSCKEAGRLLQAGRSEQLIKELHKQCPAITMNAPTQCTCAHLTESILANPTVIYG